MPECNWLRQGGVCPFDAPDCITCPLWPAGEERDDGESDS